MGRFPLPDRTSLVERDNLGLRPPVGVLQFLVDILFGETRHDADEPATLLAITSLLDMLNSLVGPGAHTGIRARCRAQVLHLFILFGNLLALATDKVAQSTTDRLLRAGLFTSSR